MPRGAEGGKALRAEDISSLARHRLATRVHRTPSGCLLWQGAKNQLGYGQMSRGGGHVVLVHRAAYALAHGVAPAAIVIRHTCNRKLCINLDHLVAGTQAENMADYARTKLPWATKVRAAFAAGETVTQLAKRYRVTKGTIAGVIDNRTYVDPEYEPEPYDDRDRRRRSSTKLGMTELAWAREQRSLGRSYNSLAAELEVSMSTLYEALNGRYERASSRPSRGS